MRKKPKAPLKEVMRFKRPTRGGIRLICHKNGTTGVRESKQPTKHLHFKNSQYGNITYETDFL